mmetsp:Transcript_39864/g.97971  ORF Transcript_39864/g.97971 Transcript_39864/m.97971 type:complete len:270 (+) Transcript_39864:627-1436(+)
MLAEALERLVGHRQLQAPPRPHQDRDLLGLEAVDAVHGLNAHRLLQGHARVQAQRRTPPQEVGDALRLNGRPVPDHVCTQDLKQAVHGRAAQLGASPYQHAGCLRAELPRAGGAAAAECPEEGLGGLVAEASAGPEEVGDAEGVELLVAQERLLAQRLDHGGVGPLVEGGECADVVGDAHGVEELGLLEHASLHGIEELPLGDPVHREARPEQHADVPRAEVSHLRLRLLEERIEKRAAGIGVGGLMQGLEPVESLRSPLRRALHALPH